MKPLSYYTLLDAKDINLFDIKYFILRRFRAWTQSECPGAKEVGNIIETVEEDGTKLIKKSWKEITAVIEKNKEYVAKWAAIANAEKRRMEYVTAEQQVSENIKKRQTDTVNLFEFYETTVSATLNEEPTMGSIRNASTYNPLTEILNPQSLVELSGIGEEFDKIDEDVNKLKHGLSLLRNLPIADLWAKQYILKVVALMEQALNDMSDDVIIISRRLDGTSVSDEGR